MAENVDYSKVKSNLISYLNSLGKDDGVVDSIVDLLETVDVPKSPQCRIYCKFYTIALFQTYCRSDDDAEVMLAASGLLKGFEDISKEIEKCRTAYWKHANGYSNLLKKSWKESTQIKRLGEARERITKYLADDIISVFSNQKDELRLAKKYEFPSVLELPSPRESREERITWPFYPCKPVSTELSPTEPHPVEPSPVEPPSEEPHPVEPSPVEPPATSISDKIFRTVIFIVVIVVVSFTISDIASDWILAANHGYRETISDKGREIVDYRKPDAIEPAESNYSNDEVVDGTVQESNDTTRCFLWEKIKDIFS